MQVPKLVPVLVPVPVPVLVLPGTSTGVREYEALLPVHLPDAVHLPHVSALYHLVPASVPSTCSFADASNGG